jgi:hypothetical protein
MVDRAPSSGLGGIPLLDLDVLYAREAPVSGSNSRSFEARIYLHISAALMYIRSALSVWLGFLTAGGGPLARLGVTGRCALARLPWQPEAHASA